MNANVWKNGAFFMFVHSGCDVLGHKSQLSREEDLLSSSSVGIFPPCFFPPYKGLSVIFSLLVGFYWFESGNGSGVVAALSSHPCFYERLYDASVLRFCSRSGRR